MLLHNKNDTINNQRFNLVITSTHKNRFSSVACQSWIRSQNLWTIVEPINRLSQPKCDGSTRHILCPPSSLSRLIPTHPTPHNRNRVHLFPSNAKTSCAWRALDLFLSLPFFCPIPRSLHSTRFLTIGFGEFLLNITTLSEYLKMSVLAVEQLAER